MYIYIFFYRSHSRQHNVYTVIRLNSWIDVCPKTPETPRHYSEEEQRSFVVHQVLKGFGTISRSSSRTWNERYRNKSATMLRWQKTCFCHYFCPQRITLAMLTVTFLFDSPSVQSFWLQLQDLQFFFCVCNTTMVVITIHRTEVPAADVNWQTDRTRCHGRNFG